MMDVPDKGRDELALSPAVNPGSSHHAFKNDGWLDMYSTKSAISAQAVSWFDKLQPPVKPPAAARCLSCISSRSQQL